MLLISARLLRHSPAEVSIWLYISHWWSWQRTYATLCAIKAELMAVRPLSQEQDEKHFISSCNRFEFCHLTPSNLRQSKFWWQTKVKGPEATPRCLWREERSRPESLWYTGMVCRLHGTSRYSPSQLGRKLSQLEEAKRKQGYKRKNLLGYSLI